MSPSNAQLTFAAVAALAIHLLVLAVSVIRRRPQAAFILNLVAAAAILAAMLWDPKWLRAPIDLPVACLAGLELLVLVAAAIALRRHRAAAVASWITFGLHLVASGLAVAFVLTFKITRLF